MSSSTNKGRDPTTDFYATPRWCVTALYDAVPWIPVPSFDPCAGHGALMDESMYGVEIDPSRARVGAIATACRIRQADGLAVSWRGEDILMNPPFANIMDWLLKGLREARSMVCLMRVGMLCGGGRAPLWRHYPPNMIAYLVNRPFPDSADYAWVVWSGLDILRLEAAREYAHDMCKPKLPVEVQSVWLNREAAGEPVTRQALRSWVAWQEQGVTIKQVQVPPDATRH